MTSAPAVAVAALPLTHRNPFDHLLIAQVIVETITLLTAGMTILHDPGPIRRV